MGGNDKISLTKVKQQLSQKQGDSGSQSGFQRLRLEAESSTCSDSVEGNYLSDSLSGRSHTFHEETERSVCGSDPMSCSTGTCCRL